MDKLSIILAMLMIMIVLWLGWELHSLQMRRVDEDIDRLETAVSFLMDQVAKLNPNILPDMEKYFDKLKKQLK